MPLSIPEFVRRWKINVLSERSGAQSHFIDLCEMLGQPHPAAADSTGERYTFEKPIPKIYGGKGFADVWLRDHFAWEYKGKHKDLKAAFKQLNDYRRELENPPLLVVCDMERFQVHTNFTNTSERVYSFDLDDLNRNQPTATCPLPPLEVLRALFGDTNLLRPNRTDAHVTQEAAKVFARLAERLEIEKRSHTESPIHTKQEIAHFLMRLLFCLFADSIGLLPNHLFRNLVQSADRFLPKKFLRKLRNLFEAMSQPDGIFGEHTIKYFNGGLFDSDSIIELDTPDLGILYEVSKNYNWAHVAPEIFGTLFERSLNAERRSLIGAHYTSAEDILLLIEPVLMQPLERRWAKVRANILAVLDTPQSDATPEGHAFTRAAGATSAEGAAAFRPLNRPSTIHGASAPDLSGENRLEVPNRSTEGPGSAADAESEPVILSGGPELAEGAESKPVILSAARGEESKDPEELRPAKAARTVPTTKPRSLLASNPKAEAILSAWIDELTSIRVLDPACGSGNFLYLALRRMLDLWLEAQRFAAEQGISLVLPKMVSPAQLFGIETEFYAHELASIVVWIGFLQWKHEHGVTEDREPILQKLANIQHADAILRYDADGKPYEPEWPKADFIIGNPPFLGDKFMRRELTTTEHPNYVDDLRALYEGRVPGGADLVTFWFEKARTELEAGNISRVGLLATQGIRGGANRNVLERILQTGRIFWAWSDRDWLLDGANVHVSMVGFEKNPLTWLRVAEAKVPEGITEGDDISAFTDELGGSYVLDGESVSVIHADLTSGANTVAASRLTENAAISFIGPSPHGRFDIDNDSARKMLSAPLNVNGRPNSDVVRPVANAIDLVRTHRNVWTVDFGSDMPLEQAAKYEMPFEFVKATIYPERKKNNRKLYKEKWWLYGEPRPGMRKAISQMDRLVATPRVSKHRIFVWQKPPVLCNDATVVFARADDYFLGVLHSVLHEQWARAQGTQLREVESGFRYTPESCFDTFPFPWPPGTEPSEAESPIVKAIADAARELVRLRDNWLNPPGASEEDLRKRTLTNLYNQRPEWLANAHRTLDEAVFAAYGWPSNLTRDQILANLLALNHQRAAGAPSQVR